MKSAVPTRAKKRFSSMPMLPTWVSPSSQRDQREQEDRGRRAEGAAPIAASELDVAPREQRADQHQPRHDQRRDQLDGAVEA